MSQYLVGGAVGIASVAAGYGVAAGVRRARRHVGPRLAWGWYGGIDPGPEHPRAVRRAVMLGWLVLFTVLHPGVTWRAFRNRHVPLPEPAPFVFNEDLFRKDDQVRPT